MTMASVRAQVNEACKYLEKCRDEAKILALSNWAITSLRPEQRIRVLEAGVKRLKELHEKAQ